MSQLHKSKFCIKKEENNDHILFVAILTNKNEKTYISYKFTSCSPLEISWEFFLKGTELYNFM